MKLLGAKWSRGRILAPVGVIVALLAIPGMPKMIHGDSDTSHQVQASGTTTPSNPTPLTAAGASVGLWPGAQQFLFSVLGALVSGSLVAVISAYYSEKGRRKLIKEEWPKLLKEAREKAYEEQKGKRLATKDDIDNVVNQVTQEENVKWGSVHQQEPKPQPREPASSPGPSSQDIRLHLVTQAGHSDTIDTPQDIRVDDFIKEVVEGLDLPRRDAEGRPVNWTLDNQDTGQRLELQLTLAESGVRNGHHLHLRREVVAGGNLEPREPEHDSQVQLSVHYPPQVTPNVWSTLLTYVHVPDTLRMVQEHTNRRLGRKIADGYLRTTGIAMTDIGRGAEITIVPSLPDCVVSPERAKFLWLQDWHCEVFQFKSTTQESSRPLVGQIAFFVGPILICDIAVFIRPSASASAVKGTTTTSDPYQSIFVSYAHDDSVIVEELEKAYTVLGMRYLRDIRILRSGEQWNQALLSRIEEANIFQLCWSHAAKHSEFVAREWTYALGLNRECFLRPVYWQTPMPEPPSELASIHFAFLDVRP